MVAKHAVASALRPRRSTKGKHRPSYRRRVKPAFTYVQLITKAIQSSESGMMTLRKILEHMAASNECFRGDYVGWKNSVRHNLTASECFVKVLRDPLRPYGKDNFWTLNAACPHCLQLREGEGGERPRSPGPAADATGPLRPASSVSSASSLSNPSSTGRLRWASPTPGTTPGTEPAVQSADEWGHLEDLFVPDTDVDLALYKDGLELPIACPPNIPEQGCERSRSCQPIFVNTGNPWSQPSHCGVYAGQYGFPWSAQPLHYGGYHHRQDISYPWSAQHNQSSGHPHHPVHVSCPRSAQANHYHHRQDIIGSRGPAPVHIKTEPLSPARHGAAARDDKPGRRHHQLGAIVASFIRGSLSLDLDEAALLAVERSVELLDAVRPCTDMDESALLAAERSAGLAHAAWPCLDLDASALLAIDKSLELLDRTRPSDLVCA